MNNLNLKTIHFFKIILCYIFGLYLVNGSPINVQPENKVINLKQVEDAVEENPSLENIHYLHEQQLESKDDDLFQDDENEKLSLAKVYNTVLDGLKKGSFKIDNEKPQTDKITSLKRLITYKLRRDREHVEEKIKIKKPSRNEHRHIFIGRDISDQE